MAESERNDSITPFLKVAWVNRLRLVSPAMAGLAAVLSGLALVGWMNDLPLLKSGSSSFVSVKPNAAIGTLLLALGLLGQASAKGRKPLEILGAGFCILAFLIGLSTLLESVLGVNLGIDQLLFPESLPVVGTVTAGQMAPTSAACLGLLGSANLLGRSRDRRRLTASHVLAMLAGSIALFSIIGYAYGVEGLLGFGLRARMALGSALCFSLLSLGILFANSDHDLIAVLASGGPGGYLSRRLIPVAILLPFALGWMRIQGARAGLYASDLGTAAFTVSNIIIFSWVIWWTAIQLQRLEFHRQRTAADRDKLEVEARLREQFQSMLTHDLRNPLTVAQISVSMIQKVSLAGTPVARYAARVASGLSRVDRMLEDLLDASRSQAGQPLVLQLEACDLRAVISETLEDLQLVHGSRFNLEPGPAIEGYWDRAGLKRIIENLCNNAAKYGFPDRPITVWAFWLYPDRIALSVHNEGREIPPDRQATLFDPFQRGSDALTDGKKGWGIGLTVVKALSEAHQGTVSVQSSQQDGTTFTVSLPLDAGKRDTQRAIA